MHMIKRLIHFIFKSLGYRLVKTTISHSSQLSTVKVGKYELAISNNNAIKYCYEYCKDYGGQLSRLTALISQYYPDLVVLDVGANLGDSVALIKSGKDVPVISIEGDQTIHGLFERNTAQFQETRLIRTFLSDSVNNLNCTFTKVGHNLTISPGPKSEQTNYTEFSTIDKLHQDSVVNASCKLLKIDTEGFDLKIIRGGELFIDTVKPVILFEFNRENLDVVEDEPYSIFSWLKRRAYNIILFYESDGRFMFSTNLDNEFFLRQIYDYVDAKNAKIYYVDIVVFHRIDNNLAKEFIKSEEIHRLNLQ
jgi:FkbM family methyltransferase